jgi:hypothetical protein
MEVWKYANEIIQIILAQRCCDRPHHQVPPFQTPHRYYPAVNNGNPICRHAPRTAPYIKP